MKQDFVIAGGYSYVVNEVSRRDAMQRGTDAAKSHGKLLRDAVERAVCRFYQVGSLDDCNADSILDAGNHEYHEGIPFQVIDLSGGRFIIQDLKTKTEICYVGQFQVNREMQDISCIEDAITRNAVFMSVQQSYTTFDGVK